MVTIAGISVIVCLGSNLAHLQGSIRLGARRIAKHELHLVRTFGNEVIARGDVAQHDSVKIAQNVGTSLALHSDTEVARVRTYDIRQSDLPLQFASPVVVKRELIVFQLINVTRLVSRIWVLYGSDNRLLRTHLVADSKRHVVHWYDVTYRFGAIAINIFLKDVEHEVLAQPHLINRIPETVAYVAFFIYGVEVVNRNSSTLFIGSILYRSLSEGSLWIVFLSQIELRRSKVSENPFYIIVVSQLIGNSAFTFHGNCVGKLGTCIR